MTDENTTTVEALRAELARLQAELGVLRDGEAHRKAILESALDCIITMGEDQRVVEWNGAAETTFGYSRAEAVGRVLAELIIPPALREAHMRGLARYAATGEGAILGRRIEVPALRADGAGLLVELTVVPVRLEGRTLFTAQVRDLTDRERAAAQQRAFLRDVLLSVTEGRLHLCHSREELPAPLAPFGEAIPLSLSGGIADLRRRAHEAATAQGFAEDRGHDLVTAVSEAAMNSVVHAGGGEGRAFTGPDIVQVRVEDWGAGIDVARLPRATLEKGYTTAGTLGHGMKMMLFTADRVWLLTGPSGTTVVMEQARLAPPTFGLEAL